MPTTPNPDYWPLNPCDRPELREVLAFVDEMPTCDRIPPTVGMLVVDAEGYRYVVHGCTRRVPAWPRFHEREKRVPHLIVSALAEEDGRVRFSDDPAPPTPYHERADGAHTRDLSVHEIRASRYVLDLSQPAGYLRALAWLAPRSPHDVELLGSLLAFVEDPISPDDAYQLASHVAYRSATWHGPVRPL